jgi:tRNA threonylcarbamoyladenosine biosynthesis protein TsaB
MKLLALDTSTEACSVAVLVDGEIQERFELVQQRHSERILPLIDALLADAGLALPQLDALAFGRGPGSFTALRIGAGVVQGLAFGADLPVIPVSSLAALAQGHEASRVIAALDARMEQVYYGAYERDGHGLVRLVGVEAVAHPESVDVSAVGGWEGVGSGWDRHHARLRAALGDRLHAWYPQQYPRARAVALLGARSFERGERVPASEAVPVYVRDEVAHKPKA